jgi:hypothetical protein
LKSKKNTKKHDVVQTFRRVIHQGNNARGGLSAARSLISLSDIPKIISALGAQPIYKNLFAPSTFPAKPEQLKNLPRLVPVDNDLEFVWSASVLRLFAEKITDFVRDKEAFLVEFVNGNYAAAELALNLIENKYGYSLWYIQYRLQLLQLKIGLEAQKDYVEKILAADGIGSLHAWLIYYFSLRSEENVSFSRIGDEIATVLEIAGFGDYVLNHIIPYDLTQTVDLSAPVSWEEPNPLIDRYETLLSMLQLRVCRERSDPTSATSLALAQLSDIKDVRLERLNILLSTTSTPSPSETINIVDSYTVGDYTLVENSKCELLEIISRSRILSGNLINASESLSLKQQIVFGMQELLSLSARAQQERTRLRKIALTLPKHEYSFQIAAFLQRPHEFVLTESFSDLDYFASVTGPLENPWCIPVISSFSRRGRWISELLAGNPSAPSLHLRCALQGILPDEDRKKLEEMLPDYRRNIFDGHIYFASGEIPKAIASYSKATENTNTFISAHAKQYLYDALYAECRYQECLSLAVDHILTNPTAVMAYRIDELAKACLTDEDLSSSINLAILLHLNVVHVSHKWERELSDIFENVLAASGVEKPSGLLSIKTRNEFRQEVYFLRYIATPRLLGDTTCFGSVDEIESERIAICQHLLSVDPDDKEEYLSEIRGITRDTNVAHLFKKVQSSKIYVDEAGLRQSFETSLVDTFARYQKLLDSPSLAYQAEKLSKRLEEMLGAKGGAGIKDLKLPASEQEALFDTLLNDFCAEFAFSPAYGLDTHLSTTIRHGAFEGHIRTPFAKEDLLCKKRDSEYILPRAWTTKLDGFSEGELSSVTKQLGRFTSRIEELINIYLSEKLRVRETNSAGMFVFESTFDEAADLRDSITKATDYNSFLEKFFEHAWQLVDDSMTLIRADLKNFLLHQVNVACDTLANNLEHSFEHDRVVPIVDAIVRAQTEFQLGVVDVAEWFRRPQDLSRDPFDFEVAVRVALQQVRNCYVSVPLDPTLQLNVPGKIEGKLVDGICEIFFILLQNVILHSGFGDQVIPVVVNADRVENDLVISCTNNLAPDVNLAARETIAVDATGRYQRDTAMRLARQEGGSGLSKIWRIAEYDLRLKHEINLTVKDDRTFKTTVTLGLW